MSLDMFGHIDDTFVSTDDISGATRITKLNSEYVNGKWVEGDETTSPHSVTLQPLSDKEVNNLSIGAERIKDYRKLYVNDGDLYSIKPSDKWVFDNVEGTFKTHSLDNRPVRNYCKAIVVRIDPS